MNSSLFKADAEPVTLDTVNINAKAPKGNFWGSSLPIIGDVIGAGLNLISQGWTQRYNSSEANKARDFTREMWNANNAYNTPAQQMARLRAAGLNPNLMYGLPSSQAQLASSSAQASSSPQRYSIDNIANMQTLINQTKIAEAQARNLDADTNLKGVQATNTGVVTNKLDTEISKLESEIKLIDSQTAYNALNNSLFAQTFDERSKSYAIQNKLDTAQANKEYALANLYVAQKFLANQQTALVAKQMVTEAERALGISIDNNIKGVEQTLKEQEKYFNDATMEFRIMQEASKVINGATEAISKFAKPTSFSNSTSTSTSTVIRK